MRLTQTTPFTRCCKLTLSLAMLAWGVPLAQAQGLQPTSVSQPAPAPAAATAPVGTQAKPSAVVPAAGAPGSNESRSMLDQPPAAAKIQVTGDQLSIEAANASLSAVLRQVAQRTGMQIEGDSHDERVFGTYGPGTPAEVLTSLLYDSGYNVMMVGNTADGAPRKLLLSARGKDSAATPPNPQTASNSDEDEENEAPPAEVAQPAAPAIQLPTTLPAPAQGQVKTPAQILEELQRMHTNQQGNTPPQ